MTIGWTLPTSNPLLDLLHAACRGQFPAGTFTTTHLPSPSSPADAVLGFFGHHVIASDVPAEFVNHWTARDAFALSDVRFLAAFAELLGTTPGIYDVVFAAPGENLSPSDVGVLEIEGSNHPRVQRALNYRDPLTVRTFTDPSHRSVLVMGRGLAGRMEAAYEVDEAARGAGLGRFLIHAARQLAPLNEPVFLQISPGNVWSMKALLANPGWQPIGSEILFLRKSVSDNVW